MNPRLAAAAAAAQVPPARFGVPTVGGAVTDRRFAGGVAPASALLGVAAVVAGRRSADGSEARRCRRRL